MKENYESLIKNWYLINTKQVLDLDNPKTFGEKIQWLKIYEATPLKSQLSDKFLVRNWVEKRIGKEYLVNLLGVYNSFEEIDFDKLPNKFVIKWNHASGYNYIVEDKSKINFEDMKEKMTRWGDTDFSTKGIELHYKNIERKIIIEDFIEPNISQHEIQIYTFNGEIKFFTIETCKTLDNLERSTFLYPDFSIANFKISPNHYKPLSNNISKNVVYLALDLAKKLLLKEPLLRIDFVEYNDSVLFREMTFTSGSGLSKIEPKEYETILGDYIVLPKFKYDLETKEFY